jgi:hypothetical protein
MATVKITNGALDEVDGDIILRGSLDPSSLGNLLVDDYQREVLTGNSFGGLVKAFKEGKSVPDVILGMRGHEVREVDGVFTLRNPTYMVDGLQRISAAKQAMGEQPDLHPRLGATIHFGTNEAWERAQFLTLNAERVKVSPNILVRNLRHESEAIAALYALCTSDRGFTLYGRVCWNQRMRRGDVLHATTVLKVVANLHSHVGPGRSTKVVAIAGGLDTIMERSGKLVFRDNVRSFFDLVDYCWGVRNVAYSGAVHLRLTYLRCLAQIFSTHHRYFFRDNRLFVDMDTKRKLKSFPVADPHVGHLASSGGQGGQILYNLMIAHINRGRRTRRLVPVEITDSNGLADGADDDVSA